MSEEAEVVETVVDNTPSKPAGYDPVDPRTASPEEVEARLTYLYRQVKENGRTLNEFKGIAKSQSERIEELMSGYGEVVGHLNAKQTGEIETQLKNEMRAAFEAGDNARYLDAQDKLDDIRLEKKLAAKAPKQEARQAPAQSAEPAGESWVDDDDLKVINEWQAEKDESGKLLRPWAHNTSKDPNHPSEEYETALLEMQAVLKSPKFKNKSIEEKVAEVDRRMGMTKAPTQNTVMGANLTRGGKTSKLTLSPRQQEIALKTVSLDGKKIKSDADKLEWYRSQLEKTSKGARK